MHVRLDQVSLSCTCQAICQTVQGAACHMHPHRAAPTCCCWPVLHAYVQECPICTVTFPSMNTASCCGARVCTECFVYHQTSSDPPGQAQCPFCKTMPFAVRVGGGLGGRVRCGCGNKASWGDMCCKAVISSGVHMAGLCACLLGPPPL